MVHPSSKSQPWERYIRNVSFRLRGQAFQESARSRQLQERVRAFMDTHVFPNEAKIHHEMNQPSLPWTPSPTLETIKQKAKVLPPSSSNLYHCGSLVEVFRL